MAKKQSRIISLLLLILSLFTICGCGCTEQKKVDIYTTIYPVWFLTTQIVDNHLTIESVYPNGADVHDYDPGTGKTVIEMADSKAIFYIGAGLEGFMESSEDIFKKADTKLVELSESVTLIEPDGEVEEDHGHTHTADTHIWLDPLRMIQMAEKICEVVCEIDPDRAETYKTNKDNLIAKLQKLDEAYVNALKDESIKEKIILVDHDAYLYWEARYGIKRIKARINNDSCNDIPKSLLDSIELAKEKGIQYIIMTKYEKECSNITQYIKEAGVTKVELHHLGTLTQIDVNAKSDYITIMYENLATLLKVLPKVNN